MKNLIIVLSLIAMLTTFSCTRNKKADLVIINGKVLTINKDNPTVEAIAVKGETIIAIGTTSTISKYIEK